MKAYSQDLRERVLGAIDQGKTRKEVVELFDMSLSTVKRYLKQRNQMGHVRPKKIPGRPSIKQASLQEKILKHLEANPDATLAEHCVLWEEESGIKVSIMTMSRAIDASGWTRKKTIVASERKEDEREKWREYVKDLNARNFVFLDESGSSIALTRLYARAPKGKRAIGSLPRNRRKNITLLASLSPSGIGETMLIEGAANTEIFEIYVEQFLVPSLKEGQIVIMDNLSIHKGQKVRELIEARGCQLVFLPAYSPDFSPIEEAFSKIKAVLRKIGARTHEALQQAIAEALLTVTTTDALGWFRHCGYRLADGE